MPSRRNFLATGVAACIGCRINAAGLNTTIQPLVGDNYQPSDADERGIWQSLERLEEDLASSSSLLDAPDLREYTMEVLTRLLGKYALSLRVYLVQDSSFNASMCPNGMMIVHSGFMARVRNEAQFAAIVGHESGHFLRKHTLNGYRDRRTKGAVMAFVAAGANAAGGYTALQGQNGQSWIDLANAINVNLIASIFTFSRSQETEADAYGISLMAKAGYTPEAASDVWKQLIEERRQSAAMRDKRYRKNGADAFSTHPPEEVRMRDLSDTARALRVTREERVFEDGKDRWKRTISPYRAQLLDEQIKLNDPGASLYLVQTLAQDGWDGQLRFQEGEIYRLRNGNGDALKASQAYAAATSFDDAPPTAWRAHGYALLKEGRTADGRNALTRYLDLRPDASDASMVRFSLAQ